MLLQALLLCIREVAGVYCAHAHSLSHSPLAAFPNKLSAQDGLAASVTELNPHAASWGAIWSWWWLDKYIHLSKCDWRLRDPLL